jgi:hypothetical protein
MECNYQLIATRELKRVCCCGCSKEVTWHYKKKRWNEYIHGHNGCLRKGKSKYKDVNYELFCKTCGKKIEIKSHHKYRISPPEYCHGHNPSGFTRRKTKGYKLSKEAYDKFMKRQVEGYSSNCKTYWFFSKKNQKEIYFNSWFERGALEMLEQMNIVKSYERCKYVIDYELDKTAHKYVPDFLITYIGGTQEVVEIKPNYQQKYAKNVAKKEAAEKYFENLGIKYSIWSEDILKPFGIRKQNFN